MKSTTSRYPYALAWLFLATFLLLTGIRLGPMADDALISFGGFYHLLRWWRGANPQPWFEYLRATWSYAGEPGNLPLYHVYHVRFAWGFVYPLLATLYAATAEVFRRFLPPETNYVDLLVRAGSVACVLHWAITVGVVGWVVFRIREARLRNQMAVAASLAVVFDYFVMNHWAVFNGHRLFVHLHDGLVYALTTNVPRSSTLTLLGLYLALRLLEAPGGRVWLIPVSLLFHLPVATTVCLSLSVAEAVACIIQRRPTRDLIILIGCAAAGLMVSSTVGFTGYPARAEGVLPAWNVIRVVIGHALTYPVWREGIVAGLAGGALLGGCWSVWRGHAVERGRASLIVASR